MSWWNRDDDREPTRDEVLEMLADNVQRTRLDPNDLLLELEISDDDVAEHIRPGGTLPPIVVVQIYGNYHVLDGHHRTTYSRQRGQMIDALVIDSIHYNMAGRLGISEPEIVAAVMRSGKSQEDFALKRAPGAHGVYR